MYDCRYLKNICTHVCVCVYVKQLPRILTHRGSACGHYARKMGACDRERRHLMCVDLTAEIRAVQNRSLQSVHCASCLRSPLRTMKECGLWTVSGLLVPS